MPDQDVPTLLHLIVKKMNLIAPPDELGVSLDTAAAVDLRWEVTPQQVLGPSSKYQILCSFRVGLLCDEEPISFEDRSLTLPLFQALCVSDAAADEVIEHIKFREALMGLGVSLSGDDLDHFDDQH